MRGRAWDLKRSYGNAVSNGTGDEQHLAGKIQRRYGWNALKELWDTKFSMSSPDSSATFTYPLTRKVSCYTDSLPAAGNPPADALIPLNIQAIVGGYWDSVNGIFSIPQSMHPQTNTETLGGIISVPEEFATRVDTTAYVVGNKFAVLSDNGNWMWAICTSAGTTAGALPVYVEADIGGAAVTDDSAEFSVKGFATLHNGGTMITPSINMGAF